MPVSASIFRRLRQHRSARRDVDERQPVAWHSTSRRQRHVCR